MTGLRVSRVAAPASGIVTVAEAKAQCRVDADDDDVLFDRLVKLASTTVEERTGKALVTQDWALKLSSASGCVSVPNALCPVQSVVSIAYTDTADQAQVADVADFDLIGDEDGANLVPKTGKQWPVTNGQLNALVITLRCGFGVLADVPENLRHAALMLIGHWYENRENSGESMSEMNDSARDLIRLSQRRWVG